MEINITSNVEGLEQADFVKEAQFTFAQLSSKLFSDALLESLTRTRRGLLTRQI